MIAAGIPAAAAEVRLPPAMAAFVLVSSTMLSVMSRP